MEKKHLQILASMGSKVTRSFDATNGAHLHVSVCSISPFPRLVQVLDAPMSILKDGKEMAETLKEQLATARTRMGPDGPGWARWTSDWNGLRKFIQ